MVELTIRFKNNATMHDFATWLVDQGEQDFASWRELSGDEPACFANHVRECNLITQED